MTNDIGCPLLSVISKCLLSSNDYMILYSPSTALGVVEILLSGIVGY